MTSKKAFWLAAFAFSAAIHGVFFLSLASPSPSLSSERAAGETISVSGSLSSVLGNPVHTSSAAPEQVQVEEVTEIEPVRAAPPEGARPVEAKKLVSQSQVEAANVVASLAKTPTSEIEELTPVATESVEANQPSKAPEPKAEKVEPRPQKTRTEKKARRKAKKASEARRSARAGSDKRGADGEKRGGQRGRSAASGGAIRSYGARVRARILSNRPGSIGRGVVLITFAVSRSGGLRYARISRSSGSSSIDRAALSTVRRSAPFPPPPAAANARQLRFTIPFKFR